MYIYIYICKHVCMYLCICVCVCVYINTYVYVFVYMCMGSRNTCVCSGVLRYVMTFSPNLSVFPRFFVTFLTSFQAVLFYVLRCAADC